MTGAYTYTITGPEVPADVAGLTAAQQGGSIHISWNDNLAGGIVGADIFWGEAEQGIEGAYQLASGARNTEITTTKIPPGDWVIYAVWRNINGDVSATPAEFPITVVDYNTVLYHQTYEYIPNVLSGLSTALAFFRHWTGKLIPTGQYTCDQYVAQGTPMSSNFQLDYVPGGDFEDKTYYFRFTLAGKVSANDTFTTGETPGSSVVSIDVPAGNLPVVTTDYQNSWNVYASTNSGAQTLQSTAALGAYNYNNVEDIQFSQEQWQMPITGLSTDGASVPSSDTTGWDVFDNFCPNPQGLQGYLPYLWTDTLLSLSKRVSLIVNRNIGYGQAPTGIFVNSNVDEYYSINNMISGDSTASYPVLSSAYVTNFTCGVLEPRYLQPYIIGGFLPGQAYYIDSITMIVDNPQTPSVIPLLHVESTGTEIQFADYGLAYHVAPTVQATVVSTDAISATVTNITSSSATVNLFLAASTTDGDVNLTITGI